MHLLIYDPNHAGHHLNWVKLVADAYAEQAHRITFATAAETPNSSEFAEHLRSVPAQFQVDATIPWHINEGGSFGTTKVAVIAWQGLMSSIERHRPDRVFIPYADDLLLTPAVRFPRPMRLPIPPDRVDGIILAAGFAYPGMPFRPRLRARAKLFGLGLLPIGRLLFVDAIAHEWVMAHRPRLRRRCILCPDPTTPVPPTEKVTARTRLGIPATGRLISCVGMMDRRKGIDEFAGEFAHAPLGREDRLLLAGRASRDVHDAVERAGQKIPRDRIILLDRLLSRDEFDMALAAADMVAITHRFPDHIGSASILIRAASVRRPVFASAQGWPGMITRKYGLGEIYPANAADRPAAIAKALDAATAYIPSRAAEEFVAFHSVERFERVVTRDERLGDVTAL